MIGFDDNMYSVNEGDGDVTLTIRVRGGTTQCIEREWMVHFSTTPTLAQCKNTRMRLVLVAMDVCSISYTAPEDYIHMSANLTLTNTSQAQVTVPIVGDALLERNETFRAEINLIRVEDSNCVILQPDTVDITILNDDSEL